MLPAPTHVPILRHADLRVAQVVSGTDCRGGERRGRRWLHSGANSSSWVCGSAMLAAQGWGFEPLLRDWWASITGGVRPSMFS